MPKVEITQAKVATLVDSWTVAINAGTSDGIREGDELTLYRIVEVTDPDTNELLGSVRLPKLKLNVSMVKSRYSLARVNERVPTENSGSPMDLFRSLAPWKKMTDDQFHLTTDSLVQIKIGELGTVHREGSSDEPPF